MMLLGGAVAAPLSAWLASRLDARVLGTGVGTLIIFLNVDRALALFGFDATIGLWLRVAVVIVALAVVGWLFLRGRNEEAASS